MSSLIHVQKGLTCTVVCTCYSPPSWWPAAYPCMLQAPLVGASDPDALFHSSDPKLNANKQAAYHIVKNLLEAGHWELADKYLTERYIQHNPNAASGRDGVVKSSPRSGR